MTSEHDPDETPGEVPPLICPLHGEDCEGHAGWQACVLCGARAQTLSIAVMAAVLGDAEAEAAVVCAACKPRLEAMPEADRAAVERQLDEARRGIAHKGGTA